MMDLTLSFSPDSPPLSVLAAAKLSGLSLSIGSSLPSASPPLLLSSSSGVKLQGNDVILRYIGRMGSLYGHDALESAQIDQWLEYAHIFSSGSEFENACIHVDGYLSLRTCLVGSSLSIADIAIWSGLAGTGQRWESLRKSKKYPNLVRWFNSVVAENETVLNAITSMYVGKRGLGKPVSSKTVTNQPLKGNEDSKVNTETNEKEKVAASFEVDLPGAKIGEVCLRFAPEPSGYLHMGHTKAALLNKYFAERYRGKLIIRFDDTNPAKESNEFVENLLKDIETLGIKYDCVTYTSDYFPQLMEMAERLIKEGKAYIDDTPREQMQKERMDGIESSCRNNSIEKNLELWREMKDGSERGQQCCLRGKLDMQALNKSLRDPVYYRCNPISHHRVGSKYKLYPTYDFACPFVDAYEGVTHALRSSEYHDRNDQYYMIVEDMGLRRVQVYEFSRLNMVYTLLSKRKLLWFVQNGKVEGWDDPRFPTVQGIVRRGLQIEALIQFILQQGASKNLNLMEWDKLWTINKKTIDPICPRHTAVLAGRGRSLPHFKVHDTRRHARILGALDLPIGGIGLPTESGLYFAEIGLGTPPKNYYVQVDTGSDILWVNCIECKRCPRESDLGIELTLYDMNDSSSALSITCDQPFCSAINGGLLEGCKPDILCPYNVMYGDGSATSGYYVKDSLHYDRVSGNFQTTTANATVIFGCGAHQSGDLGSSGEAVDGILGFGQSNSSIISQLASSGKVKKIFAHCLNSIDGGGIFAIGNVVQPKVKTTPLVPNQSHYNVRMKAVEVGETVLQLPSDVFDTGDRRGTIIDSGTTLAYFPEDVYNPLLNAITAYQPNLKLLKYQEFLCFQLTGSVDDVLPTVTLHFENSVSLTVYPHDYLFHFQDTIWCIGWQNSGMQSKETKDVILLGDLVLSNKLVIYNLEKQDIGWTEYNCSSSIKVQDETTGVAYTVGAHNLSSAYSLEMSFTILLLLTAMVLILIF